LGQVPQREGTEGWDLMTTEDPPNRGDVPHSRRVYNLASCVPSSRYSRKQSALKAAEDLRKGSEVIVAGPFYLKEEIIGYIDFIPRDTPLFLYTLVTSFEERVCRDAARTHGNTFSDLQRQQEMIAHLPKPLRDVERSGSRISLDFLRIIR
jgi:hypothetical protein